MELWHQRWFNNQIGFHRLVANDLLIKHWSSLECQPGANVLVPLCGKTLDMHWLNEQGHKITGVELVEKAVRSFFDEAQLTPHVEFQGEHTIFTSEDITIIQGDVFALPETMANCQAWYDRAAMVALPSEVRANYVDQIHSLCSPGAVGLMITFAYPQEQMQGPPFSLPDEEVFAVFSERFEVELLESIDLEDEKDRGLSQITSSVFKIKRT